MADISRLKALSNDDIAQNTASQLLICLVVDSSYSMVEKHRMDIVNSGIRKFLQNGTDDVIARDSLDICIITFGGTKARVVQPFTNIQKITYTDITPQGGTPMKEALQLAITNIRERRQYWSSLGREQYHPWLIVLSDGKSDDDISTEAEGIKNLIQRHKLKGKFIGIGIENDRSDLSRLSVDGKVDTMDDLELIDFFNMLSRSAAKMSVQSPDDDDDSFNIKF